MLHCILEVRASLKVFDEFCRRSANSKVSIEFESLAIASSCLEIKNLNLDFLNCRRTLYWCCRWCDTEANTILSSIINVYSSLRIVIQYYGKQVPEDRVCASFEVESAGNEHPASVFFPGWGLQRVFSTEQIPA